MLGLWDKDIKAVILTVSHMFKVYGDTENLKELK